jgi:hypothetical protein
MPLNEQLAGLVAWHHEQLRGWADGLSDAEREAAGQPDAWAARDLLVHFAEWAGVQREQLAAVIDGRELPALPPDDEINRQFFDRNRDRSWADALDRANSTHDALVTQIRAMTDESLAAPRASDNRPVWWDIVFGTAYHLLRHLSENLMARGERDAADALMEDGMARLATVNDAPEYTGIIAYNLACHYALNGHPARAVETLRDALTIRPDMAGYAADDPDFAALRDDPAFRALVDQ